MKEIIGKNILVAGLGLEGRSVVSFLENQDGELKIAVADQNPESVEGINYETYTGVDYLSSVSDFDTVVRSPGISKEIPELKEAKHITTATNIFFSECSGITIGVTGTKGKSTTSSLISHILKSSGKDSRLVGNIGIPALEALDGATKDTIFVAELSSYQLDDVRYSPHIAVVLPILEEHLDYHGSFESYVNAKSNIVRFQNQEDTVIFYKNNSESSNIAKKSKGQAIAYPNKKTDSYSVWLEGEWIYKIDSDGAQKKLIHTRDLQLIGKANAENVIAAIIATKLFDIDDDSIVEALKTFKPLDHRLEPVGVFKSISFINDSLATVPHATNHALEALDGKVNTLIAGGHDRGLDYSPLAESLVASQLSALILLPDTGTRIKEEILKRKSNPDFEIFLANSMDEAVRLAYDNTPKNGVCLLSPASSSYNMFANYAERGNAFKELVRKYGD